jgi:hypothetical protein
MFRFGSELLAFWSPSCHHVLYRIVGPVRSCFREMLGVLGL